MGTDDSAPLQAKSLRGVSMKRILIVSLLPVLAGLGGLAGCTDLKPLQAQVDELKSQVSQLQAQTKSATASADAANHSAQEAAQTAAGAQATANQALAAAQAAQSANTATNEKIDRMFQHGLQK
jgi:outer membrane murein-binding lipoprotein Lpp